MRVKKKQNVKALLCPREKRDNDPLAVNGGALNASTTGTLSWTKFT